MILGFGLMAGCSAATLATDPLTGVVRNQSQGLPAAGDEVILLRLDQGMQEEARTKTDSQGAFTLKARYPDKLYLVRVIHQGVNYDQRASGSTALSIDVFDAAPQVRGVTGSIEIIRAGSNGNLLHVSDMVEIKNESNPPLTQAGERTFEVYLPANAKIDSVLAAGPGKIGVLISATPVSGEPGHYTVSFPLRPGATKFAFNYDIPYNGHAVFRTKLAYPLQQLAVMFPPTMKFSSRSPAFRILAAGNSEYQVQAASQVKAGPGPGFELSGAGAIPPMNARAPSTPPPQARAPASSAPPAPVSPGPRAPATGDLSSAAPAAPASEPSSLQWRVLGAAAVVVFGTCGFLVWRARRLAGSRMETKTKTATTQTSPLRPSTTSLLEALKEELLELETGRLDGSISREEYDAAKRALEVTVKRALTRAAARS